MFVEDSNKESETVKPRTSQEASAPATVAVPSPVVTSVPAPTIMASYQTGGTQDQRSESSWPWLSGTSSVSGTDEAVYPWWDYTSQSCFRFYSRHDPRMTKDVVLASIDTYLGVNEGKQSFVRKLLRIRQRIFVSSSFVRNWKLSRTSRLISIPKFRRIRQRRPHLKLERMQPSTRLRIAWMRTRSDWHKFCKYDAAWRFKSL